MRVLRPSSAGLRQVAFEIGGQSIRPANGVDGFIAESGSRVTPYSVLSSSQGQLLLGFLETLYLRV